LALVACALWLAGFELMPWLHVAFHDQLATHRHDATGTIVRVSFGEPTHRHADGTVHRGEDHATRPDHDARVLALVTHGQGSLAHHGVAAVPTAPPLHEPLPIDRRPTFVESVATIAPVSLAAPLASARGPPTTTTC
jgi:hypothetical protein